MNSQIANQLPLPLVQLNAKLNEGSLPEERCW